MGEIKSRYQCFIVGGFEPKPESAIFGLTSIKPAPNPPSLEDPYTYKPYLGMFIVGIVRASSGHFSVGVVNSIMKSASYAVRLAGV